LCEAGEAFSESAERVSHVPRSQGVNQMFVFGAESVRCVIVELCLQSVFGGLAKLREAFRKRLPLARGKDTAQLLSLATGAPRSGDSPATRGVVFCFGAVLVSRLAGDGA
jgi:hypothetical protein